MSKKDNLPFQNVSAVIGQVTSANELWDLDGFSNSCEGNRLQLLCFVRRWQHRQTATHWLLSETQKAQERRWRTHGAQVTVGFKYLEAKLTV